MNQGAAVRIVPKRPLLQCRLWLCERDISPYCSPLHDIQSIMDEASNMAGVVSDPMDDIQQQRLSQKVLFHKSVNRFCGVPILPQHVLNYHSPWELPQFAFDPLLLLEGETSRSFVFLCENVHPGPDWQIYDTRAIFDCVRRRYNLRPQPDFGSFKLHKYTRPSYEARALFWMTYTTADGPGKKPKKAATTQDRGKGKGLGDEAARCACYPVKSCITASMKDLSSEELGVEACIKLFEQLADKKQTS